MIRLLSAMLAAISLLTAPIHSCASEENDEFFRQLVADRYVTPFREGNIDLWISAFEENAIAMHNRRPIDRGRDAIGSFGRAVHQYLEIKEYDVQVTDIRRAPNWVYTVGSYTSHFVSREDGSAPFGREQGKFLLLWARQDNGEWKIILDTGNSNK